MVEKKIEKKEKVDDSEERISKTLKPMAID